MLAIRLQRVGRKKLAQYRVIVQESHRSPSSGRVVASLGSYDPHSKKAQVDTELASKYLTNGAQPSDRVARILNNEGVKLPTWVNVADNKKREIRNPEKLRKNRPEEPKEEAPAASEETPVEAEAKPEEVAAEPAAEKVEENSPVDGDEKPAEEPKAEESEPSAPVAEEKPAEAAEDKKPEAKEEATEVKKEDQPSSDDDAKK